MKKLLQILGIVMVVLVGGCSFVSCVAVQTVDEALTETVNEIEEESNKQQEAVNKMFENVEWEIIKDDWSTTITAVVTNNSDVKIDYVEVEYKLYDENGVTIESSFTNATDIEVGESRKIEIYVIEDDFSDWSWNVTSNVFE